MLFKSLKFEVPITFYFKRMPRYLIFAQKGTIEIIEHASHEIMLTCNGEQHIVTKSDFAKTVKPFLRQVEAGKKKSLQIQTPDATHTFEQLKACYDRFIVAAGGLVKNKQGDLLLIFRNGRWDLPKGKVEPHEQTDAAALREVQEETGLQKLTLLFEFQRTYHTYVQNEQRVLKETVWYLMQAQGGALMPQQDEGITHAEWADKHALTEACRNTYDNILLLLKSYSNRA